MRNKLRAAAVLLAVSTALTFASCGIIDGSSDRITEITEETAQTAASEPLVRNAPTLANGYEIPEDNEPFSSYTYDFSVYGSNYMITVTPDENGTGLNLTVEDNQFSFSKFSVTPPDNYIVNLPPSQQYANQVCTIIKGGSEEGDIPDLLKINFYLIDSSDESLPYSVSRLYSILNDRLVEVEVYNTEADLSDSADVPASKIMGRSAAEDNKNVLDRMGYIPESDLYRTENLKFMPEPVVTVNEDGSLETEIITYTLNPNDMTMRRARETWTDFNRSITATPRTRSREIFISTLPPQALT